MIIWEIFMTGQEESDKILIFGIGNIGRSDDALGWMFLDRLKGRSNFELEYRYQLQIEDAELISKYQKVIFVDAHKQDLEEGFYFKRCKGVKHENLNSHALLPETVVWLSEQLFQSNPEAFVLAIQGYSWDLALGVSDKALINLEKAMERFVDVLSLKA